MSSNDGNDFSFSVNLGDDFFAETGALFQGQQGELTQEIVNYHEVYEPSEYLACRPQHSTPTQHVAGSEVTDSINYQQYQCATDPIPATDAFDDLTSQHGYGSGSYQFTEGGSAGEATAAGTIDFDLDEYFTQEHLSFGQPDALPVSDPTQPAPASASLQEPGGSIATNQYSFRDEEDLMVDSTSAIPDFETYEQSRQATEQGTITRWEDDFTQRPSSLHAGHAATVSQHQQLAPAAINTLGWHGSLSQHDFLPDYLQHPEQTQSRVMPDNVLSIQNNAGPQAPMFSWASSSFNACDVSAMMSANVHANAHPSYHQQANHPGSIDEEVASPDNGSHVHRAPSSRSGRQTTGGRRLRRLHDNQDCLICDRQFRYPKDYIRHLGTNKHKKMVEQTPESSSLMSPTDTSVRCPYCSNTYTRLDNANRHIKTDHPLLPRLSLSVQRPSQSSYATQAAPDAKLTRPRSRNPAASNRNHSPIVPRRPNGSRMQRSRTSASRRSVTLQSIQERLGSASQSQAYYIAAIPVHQTSSVPPRQQQHSMASSGSSQASQPQSSDGSSIFPPALPGHYKSASQVSRFGLPSTSTLPTTIRPCDDLFDFANYDQDDAVPQPDAAPSMSRAFTK